MTRSRVDRGLITLALNPVGFAAVVTAPSTTGLLRIPGCAITPRGRRVLGADVVGRSADPEARLESGPTRFCSAGVDCRIAHLTTPRSSRGWLGLSEPVLTFEGAEIRRAAESRSLLRRT